MVKNLVIAVLAFIAGAIFWAYASRAVDAQGANVAHIPPGVQHQPKSAGRYSKVNGEVMGFSCAGDQCFVMTH